jgi:hypothetical protein
MNEVQGTETGPSESEKSKATATATTSDDAAASKPWWNHEDFPYSAPWWLRYPTGVAVFYGAHWVAFEWEKKAGWILGLLLAIIGLGLLRELFFGILIAAVVGLVLWAIGAAAAALPVSAAILIGAMIIASALRR